MYTRTVATVLFTFAAAHAASAQTLVRCEKFIQTGERPAWADGATVTALETPFTDTEGKVGFVGVLTPEVGAERVFVFHDDGPVFTSNQAPTGYVLTGRESTMGIATGGRFIYSPSINGNDGLWSSAGYIISQNDPAPGAPGKFIKFASGPTMFGDGNFAFIAGYSNAPGAITTDRALYRGIVGIPGLALIYKTGDVIAGETLRFTTPSLSFTYDSSDNAQHLIHIVGAESSSLHSLVLKDGAFIARYNDAIAFSNYLEAWENFFVVGVNNAGHWMICGDSVNYDSFSSDGFVAFNGVGIVHENDTVGGITLTSPASCRAASLNNSDQIAHLWQYTIPGGTAKALFVGEGATLGSSIKVVATGDQLDVDGDGVADFTVKDLPENRLSSAAMDIAEDGRVATRVVVRAVGATADTQAIIRFCYANCDTGGNCPPCAADFNQDGGVTGNDVQAFFVEFEAGVTCGDVNLDGGVTGDDVVYFFGLFEAGGC